MALSCRQPSLPTRRIQWVFGLVVSSVVLMGSFGSQTGCAGPKECEFNSDCDHAYCSDGECKRDCRVAEIDCLPGSICNTIGKCQAQDGGVVTDGGHGGSAGSGPDGSAGGTSGAAGSGGTVPDASVGGSGNGGTSAGGSGGGSTGGSAGQAGGGGSGLQQLDTCTGEGQCASPLLCRDMTVGGDKRCTRTCTSTAQCPTNMRCSKLPTNAEQVCTFDDVGQTCNGTGQCGFACATPTGGNTGYCTAQCNTGFDCPAGWGCFTPQNACMRLDQVCTSSNAALVCFNAQLCDGYNMLVSGCTIPCTSPTDCPQRSAVLPPWTCEGNYCTRPGDVLGPVGKGETSQWFCYQNQVVNLCGDGLATDATPPTVNCSGSTSVPGSGVFLASCLLASGCGAGFACIAGLAQVDASTGVAICVKTGFVEFGHACSQNEDCIFGLCQGNKCSRDCTGDGLCPSGSTCVNSGGAPVEGKQIRHCN